MRKLSPSRLRVLRTLARYAQDGLLTCQLGEKVGLTTASARRLCVAMRPDGLVERHPHNDQRWWATDAGRATLAEMEANRAALAPNTTEGRTDRA